MNEWKTKRNKLQTKRNENQIEMKSKQVFFVYSFFLCVCLFFVEHLTNLELELEIHKLAESQLLWPKCRKQAPF